MLSFDPNIWTQLGMALATLVAGMVSGWLAKHLHGSAAAAGPGVTPPPSIPPGASPPGSPPAGHPLQSALAELLHALAAPRRADQASAPQAPGMHGPLFHVLAQLILSSGLGSAAKGQAIGQLSDSLAASFPPPASATAPARPS